MALEFTASYTRDTLGLFRHYKKLAEGALAQAPDDRLAEVLDAEGNSIATLVKHMSGNMRSRFTDFLTSDGEKPDRNRDGEFEEPPQGREALMALWEEGWATLFAAIETLTDEDLKGTVYIRGEAHSVLQALNRQVAHYSYHIGQIVLLSKHFGCEQWKAITVPRGKSGDYNRSVQAGETSQR